MKYGIISDIHSNYDALQAVLKKLEDVDRILCPGDIVGYGPDPEKCCEALRSLNCSTVIGNHDAALSGWIDWAWFNPYAKEAAAHNRKALNESDINYLKTLPPTYLADEFIMVHGSLAEPMSFPYVFSPSTARPCFEEMKDYTLCFIGHTHVSEIYVQRFGELGVDQFAFAKGGKLDLKPGFRYIVNCGSVGQPRDGNKNAACGIYDSDANSIEIMRIEYHINAVQARMRKENLPEFLINRLENGE